MLHPDHSQGKGSTGSGTGSGSSSDSLGSENSSPASTASSLPLRPADRPSSSAFPVIGARTFTGGRVTPTQPSLDSLGSGGSPPPAKPAGRRPSTGSMAATSPPVLAEVVYDDPEQGGGVPVATAAAAASRRASSRGASFEIERGRSQSPPAPSSHGSTGSAGSRTRLGSSIDRLNSKQQGQSTRSTRSRSRSASQQQQYGRGRSQRDGGGGRGARARGAVGTWWASAKKSRQFKWGFVLFVVGLVLCTIAGLVDVLGRAYRHAKIREAIVVDSFDHPEYDAWVGGSQIKTPVFWSYSFYNITNPSQFLLGKAPVVQEVGPFTFQMRTRKYNVSFLDRGRLVSYIQLTQHDYVGEPKDLNQAIYAFNLPYSVAVHTAGSETNLLKLGSQQALAELLFQMQAYFMPTLKENAVVTAIQTATKALQDAFDTMQQPDDAVAIRWGGGCTSTLFGKVCGFSTMATFLQAMDRKNKMDLNLLQLCINTKLTEAQAIPLAKVKAIWNPNDRYSMLNIDRFNASVRYGISYWLWGDADVVDTITARFGINTQQFYILRSYLLNIYKSPMLESEVVKMFLESLPEEERGFAEIGKWSDFMWRQWAVGDVITRLQNKSMANPESMQPELPPEFAWYAQSQGVQTFQYGGKRWNRTQARCMFDLAQRPMMFFQTEILNLPGPRIDRPTFVDFGFEDGDQPQLDPHACFPSSKDWELMQGYLGYLAKYFVAPELQKMVLGNNGGLVTKRTIYESLYGYAAPILQLSLAKDDPRAMKFSMLANDPSLNGPGLCLTSNDVENPYTACRFAAINTTVTDDGMVENHRLFNKVPNVYHTGRDDDSRAGAFYTYHGDRNLANIWPGGTLPFAGALKHRPGSPQYGYSDGMQFPPFNAIDGADTVLSVFVPGFVLPIYFNFTEDVVVQGVKLKRFRMAPDTFSSARADAKVFGMDQVEQDGLFNLTDLMTAATYFSKPHARPTPATYSMVDIQGVRDFDPAVDDSFIDVEPVTGKTMNANIQLQLSAGVSPTAFDAFHKTVYPARVLPVLIARQHASVVAEDAKFFKTMVYGTEKLIFLVTVVAACVGAFLLVVGLSLVLFQALQDHDAVLERVSSGSSRVLGRQPTRGSSRSVTSNGSSEKKLRSTGGGSKDIRGASPTPDGGGVVVDEEVEMAVMRHTSSRSSGAGSPPPPKPPSRRDSQR